MIDFAIGWFCGAVAIGALANSEYKELMRLRQLGDFRRVKLRDTIAQNWVFFIPTIVGLFAELFMK